MKTSKTDKVLLKLLADKFSNVSSLLEAGSNTGHLSMKLAKKGYKITLVDRLEISIIEAKRKFLLEGVEAEFIIEDIRNLNGEWDAVWNSGVVQCYPLEIRNELIDKLCHLGKNILLIFPLVEHSGFPKDFNKDISPGIKGCCEYSVTNIETIISQSFHEIHDGILEAKALGLNYPFRYIFGTNKIKREITIDG